MTSILPRVSGGRSVTGAHAAVDVQELAGDERSRLQVEHADDVTHFAPTAHRMHGGDEPVGLLGVHEGLDGAGPRRP